VKYYLSSFKIGNEELELKRITETGNKRVAFINIALDFATDLARRKQSDALDISELERLGFHGYWQEYLVGLFTLCSHSSPRNTRWLLHEKEIKSIARYYANEYVQLTASYLRRFFIFG